MKSFLSWNDELSFMSLRSGPYPLSSTPALQELQERFRASQARMAAAEREVVDAKLEAAEARQEADSRIDALAPRTPEVSSCFQSVPKEDANSSLSRNFLFSTGRL
jgi:hypothetical protein